MQSLSNLQLLRLEEIKPKLSATHFYFLTDIATSKTVDYGFIDLAKKRIDTLNKHFAAAGKANLSIISDPKMFVFLSGKLAWRKIIRSASRMDIGLQSIEIRCV